MTEVRKITWTRGKFRNLLYVHVNAQNVVTSVHLAGDYMDITKQLSASDLSYVAIKAGALS